MGSYRSIVAEFGETEVCHDELLIPSQVHSERVDGEELIYILGQESAGIELDIGL